MLDNPFPAGKVQYLSDDEWDIILDVNLRGLFSCLHSQLQRMDAEDDWQQTELRLFNFLLPFCIVDKMRHFRKRLVPDNML